MTDDSETRDFPDVVAYDDASAHREYPGYDWLKLPDVPSFGTLAGLGSDARALLCQQCGALVGSPSAHDDWHRAQG